MIDTSPVVTMDAKVRLDQAYFPMDNLYEAFAKAEDLAQRRKTVFKLEIPLFNFLTDCRYVYVDKIRGKYHLFISKAEHAKAARMLLISHDDIAFIKQAAKFIESIFNSLTDTVYTEECFVE